MKEQEAGDEFRAMDICKVTRIHLGYTFGGGFGHRWLPRGLKDLIVIWWNRVACLAVGHDDTLWHLNTEHGDMYEGAPECTQCCKTLRRCNCNRWNLYWTRRK